MNRKPQTLIISMKKMEEDEDVDREGWARGMESQLGFPGQGRCLLTVESRRSQIWGDVGKGSFGAKSQKHKYGDCGINCRTEGFMCKDLTPGIQL